jgi:two-component system, cell cycle sensor histidine kinase and response regulator CckA
MGILALAITYYSTAQVGLLIPSVGPMVCLLWPPAGLALAVLFRAGIGYWPGVLLGAYAVNLDLCGALASAIISTGVTIAVIVAVRLFKRQQFDRTFHCVADARTFILAVVIASSLAAGVGTGTLYLLDGLRGGMPARVFINWWLGDAGGMLILAPGLLAFSRTDFRRMRRDGRLRGFIVSIGIAIFACVILYSGIVKVGQLALPATFLLMLLIARTASLYRVWPASLQITYFAGWVVWNNHNLSGPSVYLEPTVRIYAAWAFLATASVVTIGIASLLAERDSVERQIQTGEETYRALVPSSAGFQPMDS